MVIIGLKKRDTFEEVVEYIKNSKDVIKFPDRYAKQIRNSFELSQLDGVGMMEHEEHEQQVMKETEKANALKKVARNADDTSHIELKAHAEQSTRSATTINTTSTIQQTDPEHHVIHTDSDTGYETAVQGYDKREVVDMRTQAELEQRVLRKTHDDKIAKLAEKHKEEMGDIQIYWNDKHHKAQEALQQQFTIQSSSALQMANWHSQIQDERHQAEKNKLAAQYQGMHEELARYRDREDQIALREIDADLGVTRARNYNDRAHKARIVTRETAFGTGGASSSASGMVPMAAPPPAITMGPIATAPRPTPAQQQEAGRRAIAAAPLVIAEPGGAAAAEAGARQGRRAPGTAPPPNRGPLILWLEGKGEVFTEAQKKNGGLTVSRLRDIAKKY